MSVELPLSEHAQGELRHDLRTPFNGILGYSDMLLEAAEEDGHDVLVAGLRGLLEEARELLATVNTELAADRSILPDALDALGYSLIAGTETLTRKVDVLLALAKESAQEATVDLQKIRNAISQLTQLSRERLLLTSTPSQRKVENVEAESEEAFCLLPQIPLSGMALVVDDNEINRDLLARRLAREGCRSAQVPSGEEALELLSRGGFDVVLLDVLMPGLDGYEVLRRIKSSAAMRDVPVIMISSLDGMSSVARCIEMGAEDYLPKPFDPVLLRARVGASLEKKRLRDRELDYLKGVAVLAEAAAAVETRTFHVESLAEVAARRDELARLARVFQHAATEVIAREQRLQQEVAQLRIEIDLAKVGQQVSEVTGGGLYDSLKGARRRLEQRRRQQTDTPPGEEKA